MILQELYKLYNRLEREEEYGISREGFSLQKISFCVELNPDGTLLQIKDECEKEGKKVGPKLLFVPWSGARTSSIKPYILWDNSAYLLNYSADSKKSPQKFFEASKERHLSLREKILFPQFQVVCKFLENWNPEFLTEDQKIILKNNGFGVFKIKGENRYVHEVPEIEDAILQEIRREQNEAGGDEIVCLVSGQTGNVARLHEPKIKNVKGAQSSGAALVSFNAGSFSSFMKDQGDNAPVSETAARKYCEALNALLRTKKHRVHIGDMTVVFWTEEKTETEDLLSFIFNPPSDISKISPQDLLKLQRVKDFLETLRSAGTSKKLFEKLSRRDESDTLFFMLGIAPNASRLAVRFWSAGTLGEFLEKLNAHHFALRIEKQFENNQEFLTIWQILRQTARDADGISPVLGGELLRSILAGAHYPSMLLPAVLRRIAIDGISYEKASVVKACLVKNFNKINESTKMETLDKENKNTAYRLGRLFAVIEKTQADALGEVNAGVGEKYYSSASSTPSVVFPTLLDLNRKHLSKLSKGNSGQAINREKLIQEIVLTINAFPKTLSLEERGLFALGYYHQKNDFFKKKTNDGNAETIVPANE